MKFYNSKTPIISIREGYGKVALIAYDFTKEEIEILYKNREFIKHMTGHEIIFT